MYDGIRSGIVAFCRYGWTCGCVGVGVGVCLCVGGKESQVILERVRWMVTEHVSSELAVDGFGKVRERGFTSLGHCLYIQAFSLLVVISQVFGWHSKSCIYIHYEIDK